MKMILDEKCMNYKVVDLTEIYTFFYKSYLLLCSYETIMSFLSVLGGYRLRQLATISVHMAVFTTVSKPPDEIMVATYYCSI
jgi:hypothetical protein